MDHQKQSGNGLDKPNSDNNVISLSNHKENYDQKKRLTEPSPPKEPFIRLPLGVKILIGMILFVHIGLWGISHFMPENFLFFVSLNFGFIPARFSGDIPFLPYSFLTCVTYTLLHGGWAHVAMNSVMLAAIGSGVEKSLGLKNMMLIFWGSTLIAILIHFILDPHSQNPVVGASGGISGLFAGIILILHRVGRLAPNKKIFPAIAVFIAISLVFGFLGAPDGSMIAWAAHIGGFLGGLLLTHFILKKGLF